VECSPSSLHRLGIVLLLTAAFVASIAALQAQPVVVRVAAWIALVMSVAAVPLGLRQVLRKAATVSLNESGVEDVRFRVGRIAWDAISAVSVLEITNQWFIQLWLLDEEAYLVRSTRWRRLLARKCMSICSDLPRRVRTPDNRSGDRGSRLR
jgi:hypothetical protein